MTDLAYSHPLRVASLPNRKPTRFDLAPDAAARAAIAQDLGLIEISALRLKGELRPIGKADFELAALLTADLAQPCSITLVPVPATISEQVLRRYLSDYTTPEGDEVEMPEDDSSDPLPEELDLGAVLVEALSLALPPYPRAPGAELGQAVFAAPGTAPLRDEDLRPFAGLAALRDKLGGDNGAES